MPIRWKKERISDERYEAAGVFDVNNDGILDIVSGAYWYEGPDFRTRHFMGEVRAEGEYYDEFSVIPVDVDGDGWTDIVTGGWFGGTLCWKRNPGKASGDWVAHAIAKVGNIETTRAWDVDNDGMIEIVPNLPMGPLTVFKPALDPSGRPGGSFDAHTLFAGPQQHGLGFGDVNGDGRGDFVLRNGWLEAPADTFGCEWAWHPEFELGNASVPIIVADINGDGVAEIIVGHAHGYGLWWWEQRMKRGGRREWIQHEIDMSCSQYHDMMWVDIDGDGQCELVTGKRYRAHCDEDPGAADDVGIYYFKWNGGMFVKHVIDCGRPGVASGCGIHFATADLDGNGRLDIVAPGKDGLFVFRNLGPA